MILKAFFNLNDSMNTEGRPIPFRPFSSSLCSVPIDYMENGQDFVRGKGKDMI